MRIKKKLFLFFVCVLFLFNLNSLTSYHASDSFLTELTDSQLWALYNGESLEAYTVTGESASAILPDNTLIKELAKQTEKLDNAFSQSLTGFAEYSQNLENLSDEDKLLAVFNISQSISTIKGIKYISHSSGYKPEVLFSDAYLIVDPKKKNSVIDDPLVAAVVEKQTKYAYLKDSRFGGNVYRLDYICKGNEIFLEITNVNTMKYMGFKCISAENLHIYLDATLAQDGVIVSGLAVVYNQKPQVKALFVTVDLPSAVLKRVDSLKNWFCNRIESFTSECINFSDIK